ncbi:hypothetical protein ACFUJR_14840 [Streptomyces sp. NPDC057271]|uniref:hypothetical protein n=1 Tax=unclassified Streptomyces TaxID=2593676 RepID=UPI003636FBC6
MALKYKYDATRSGAKQLARDIRPGDRLYIVQDNTGANAITDPKVYTEYIVIKERALDFTGTLMVCSPNSRNGRGEISAVGLLHRYRAVYSEPPAGATNIASPGRTHRPNPRLVEKLQKAAGGSDRKPVAAGRRGWF